MEALVGNKKYTRKRDEEAHIGFSCIIGAMQNLKELCLQKEHESPDEPRRTVFNAILLLASFSLWMGRGRGNKIGMLVYKFRAGVWIYRPCMSFLLLDCVVNHLTQCFVCYVGPS